MKLVQFNPLVDEDLKKAVRLDAVELAQSNNVIATAILADFYERYPERKDREQRYARMAEKMKGATGNRNDVRAKEFPELSQKA